MKFITYAITIFIIGGAIVWIAWNVQDIAKKIKEKKKNKEKKENERNSDIDRNN